MIRRPGSPTDHRLDVATEALLSGRGARRLIRRWADDPTLAGWTPPRVLDALGDPDHPDRDSLLGALIRHTQAGDHDTAVMVLAALRPGLWALVHTYHRHRPGAYDDVLTQAVFAIARADPTQDRLYHRLLGRIRVATARSRRPDHEDLVADIPEPEATLRDPVAAQVGARIALEDLGRIVHGGGVAPHTWRALLATRIHGRAAIELTGDPRAANHLRADTSRLARRLQDLIA